MRFHILWETIRESEVMPFFVLLLFKEVERTIFWIYFVVKISLNANEMLHELLIGMIYLYNNN